MITSKILLDSIGPSKKRITTWVLTYPRFYHSEVMTHRIFSRNASSSRAIPAKRMIAEAKANPAMPILWGKNQSGMQAKEEVDNITKNWTGIGSIYRTDRQQAEYLWLKARDQVVSVAEEMEKLGLHKQILNRILEPWMHITVILTGTDFENFFALRAHEDAQPEFRKMAYDMLDTLAMSTPKKLVVGEWHIPFGDKFDECRLGHTSARWEYLYGEGTAPDDSINKPFGNWNNKLKLDISTARCARVSYLNFEGKDDYLADVALTRRLGESGHWSPFEHCAQAMDSADYIGNFAGWKQYRKFFSHENKTDGRVEHFR